MSQSLSVVIAARNCADRLANCIHPWKFAQEIILVDQCSTDNTAAIAQKIGCTVIVNNPPEGNFDLNRKLGMERAKSQWILYIDTDEIPTADLIHEIKSFLMAPPDAVSGIKIPNHFYFLGRRLEYGIYNRRSAEIRMVRSQKWNYPCEKGFHHGVSVKEGSVITFKNAYKHFNVNSLSEWFIKTNQYTEHDAKPENARTWGAIWTFICFFMRHYFWKRGFLDGFHGFLSVLYFGLYHFTLSAKCWEKQFLSTREEGKDFIKPLSLPHRN